MEINEVLELLNDLAQYVPMFHHELGSKVNSVRESLKSQVLVDSKTYEKLIDNDLWVIALEGAGYDNWCGYDEAIKMYKEMKEEDE